MRLYGMSLGPVDIYKVKLTQRHLLATVENNRLISPIDQFWLQRYDRKLFEWDHSKRSLEEIVA